MKTSKIDLMNKLNTHSTNDHGDEDSLLCAPKHYVGLKDISDDYDLCAKMLHQSGQNKALAKKVEQSIDGEDLQPYGPSTNYKSKYSYNRDS